MRLKLKSFCRTALSVVLSFVICFSFLGCEEIISFLESNLPRDTQSESSEQESSESSSQRESESKSESESESESEEKGPSGQAPALPNDECFFATLKSSFGLEVSPYTDENDVPDGFEGVLYASDAPGGNPVNDGTGNIWLVLKPTKAYYISDIKIDGSYSSIESLGRDVYCIYGVASNLSIDAALSVTPSSDAKIFADFGYCISDDGKMILTWIEDALEPIRYVEVSYTDKSGSHTEYFDASLERVELFQMTENKVYDITMRAVGYTRMGGAMSFEGCYMKGPKGIGFPRVEITTEKYVWPSCEFVGSPSGAWGAGITNAFYEQCVMTIYDKANEVVYSSDTGLDQNSEFMGAKVRIRGNTSAHHVKNERFPYKIKLGAKADLLEPLIGRPDDNKVYEDKDWVLLNFGHEDFRICGDAIADAVGTAWSPDYCYVSLYVNGDYRGLYVLSESVKVGNGEGEDQARVAVDESGYLFECDAYWWNEDLYFNTPLTEKSAMYFTFKYPDSDAINEQSPEYIYIKEYMTEFETALLKNDDSYLDYIDLDSFVRWLLVSDYLCISDGGGCNIYICKKDSTDQTKLTMGPNWDFDSYMGGVDALSTIRVFWNEAPFYYGRLLKKESFQKRYVELFKQTRDSLDAFLDDAYAQIDEAAHSQLLKYDNIRFGTSTKSITTRKTEFMSWLDAHIEWMNSQFN